MFLDASALTAILAPEEDGAALADRLASAEQCFVSALVIWKTTVALARIRQSPIEVAKTLVDKLLAEIGALVIPVDAAIGTLALDALARFGKGRHPAALNMGDCFPMPVPRRAASRCSARATTSLKPTSRAPDRRHKLDSRKSGGARGGSSSPLPSILTRFFLSRAVSTRSFRRW